MKRLAILGLVALVSCGSSDSADSPDTTAAPAGFDAAAASEAWLAEVAPFVPDGLDAAIDVVGRACEATDDAAQRSQEVSYAMLKGSGSNAPFDAAMRAGCPELPDWYLEASS